VDLLKLRTLIEGYSLIAVFTESAREISALSVTPSNDFVDGSQLVVDNIGVQLDRSDPLVPSTANVSNDTSTAPIKYLRIGVVEDRIAAKELHGLLGVLTVDLIRLTCLTHRRLARGHDTDIDTSLSYVILGLVYDTCRVFLLTCCLM
jgi:hypothetical protein